MYNCIFYASENVFLQMNKKREKKNILFFKNDFASEA